MWQLCAPIVTEEAEFQTSILGLVPPSHYENKDKGCPLLVACGILNLDSDRLELKHFHTRTEGKAYGNKTINSSRLHASKSKVEVNDLTAMSRYCESLFKLKIALRL
jgi:hypothetical protein